MKVIEKVKIERKCQSEAYPHIVVDEQDKNLIEWLDANPIALEIVNDTKSKAFGRKSCVYIGWAQNNMSLKAQIQRLKRFKFELDGGWQKESIFHWRAQFTLTHYKDKGFTGGLFQQWDEYPRDCLYLDYTPETLEQVIDRFEEWMSKVYNTKRISIDGKTVREYK